MLQASKCIVLGDSGWAIIVRSAKCAKKTFLKVSNWNNLFQLVLYKYIVVGCCYLSIFLILYLLSYTTDAFFLCLGFTTMHVNCFYHFVFRMNVKSSWFNPFHPLPLSPNASRLNNFTIGGVWGFLLPIFFHAFSIPHKP